MSQPHGPQGGQTGSQMVAPTKVCPNCGVQAQTMEPTCPNCGKKYKAKKNHTVRNVLLGLVVLAILFIAGCTVLIGGAANEVSKSITADQAKSAISPSTYAKIKIGSTRAQVDKIVAPAVPQDAQEFENEGVLSKDKISSSCVYYNKQGGEFGDIYQICLEGVGAKAKVTSKNSY